MAKKTRAGSKRGNDIWELAKDFFGFGDEPKRIGVILPSVPQLRKVSLTGCKNYPLFKFEVSPDDVLSAMRVYSLLTNIYGSRVEIGFHGLLMPRPDNCVLIGGPPTHEHVYFAIRDFPIHFGADRTDRKIVGTKGRNYKVALSKEGAMGKVIRRDYCVLARYRTDAGTNVVIGGLRAYGQAASCQFLDSERFYKQADKYSSHDEFQLVVEVPVVGREYGHGWQIVDGATPLEHARPVKRVFISYVRENLRAVQKLSEALKDAKIEVWIDRDRIKVTNQWKARIKEAIDDCDYFLACFSHQYHGRDNFMDQELTWMAQRSRSRGSTTDWIVPVRLSKCKIPAHLNLGPTRRKIGMNDLQRVDVFGQNWERGIQEIVERILDEVD